MPVVESHRDVVEGGSEQFGDRRQIGMIAYHQGNRRIQFAGPHPPQDVQQAVVLSSDKTAMR